MGLIGFDADVSWTLRATGVAQTPKNGAPTETPNTDDLALAA